MPSAFSRRESLDVEMSVTSWTSVRLCPDSRRHLLKVVAIFRRGPSGPLTGGIGQRRVQVSGSGAEPTTGAASPSRVHDPG